MRVSSVWALANGRVEELEKRFVKTKLLSVSSVSPLLFE